MIPQGAGADEVWFNSGDNRYYLSEGFNPSGPVLGVVDAATNTFLTSVRSGTAAHSVAADSVTNEVFVPLGAPASAVAVFKALPGNLGNQGQPQVFSGNQGPVPLGNQLPSPPAASSTNTAANTAGNPGVSSSLGSSNSLPTLQQGN